MAVNFPSIGYSTFQDPVSMARYFEEFSRATQKVDTNNESAQEDIDNVKDSSFVVIGTNSILNNERALAGESGVVTVTDGGAGATLTLGLANDGVTFAKMQDISSDRLIGRDTASSGDPEEISVSGGIEFTGGGGIQRSALSGEVTASAGSNSTSIDRSISPTWTGTHTFDNPPVFPSYTVATLPSASPAAQMIYVSDETGGAVMAYSDGTDWRRVTDGVVVA